MKSHPNISEMWVLFNLNVLNKLWTPSLNIKRNSSFDGEFKKGGLRKNKRASDFWELFLMHLNTRCAYSGTNKIIVASARIVQVDEVAI